MTSEGTPGSGNIPKHSWLRWKTISTSSQPQMASILDLLGPFFGWEWCLFLRVVFKKMFWGQNIKNLKTPHSSKPTLLLSVSSSHYIAQVAWSSQPLASVVLAFEVHTASLSWLKSAFNTLVESWVAMILCHPLCLGQMCRTPKFKGNCQYDSVKRWGL